MKRSIISAILIIAMLFSLCGSLSIQAFAENSVQEAATNETDDAFIYLTEGFTDRKITDQLSALLAIDDVAELLGITNTLKEFGNCESYDVFGSTYYCFNQEYKGIPVYGRRLVVGADADGNSLFLSGNYLPVKDLDPYIHDVSAERIVNIIKEYFNVQNEEIELYLDNDSLLKTLCVYNMDGENTLAYQLLFEEYPVMCNEILIDALSFNVICSNTITSFAYNYDGNWRIEKVKLSGQVFKTENEDGEEETRFTKKNVDVLSKDEKYYMANPSKNIEVYKMETEPLKDIKPAIRKQSESERDKYNLTDTNNLSIYSWNKEEEPDFGVAVDALSNINVVDDFFSSLGYEGIDGKRSVPVIIVTDCTYSKNAKQGDEPHYNNAGGGYYENSNVAIISVGKTDPGKDVTVLDTMAHEYTHAIIGYWWGLEGSKKNNEASAINEALADVFGELVEAWKSKKEPDWIHGDRNIAKPGESQSLNKNPTMLSQLGEEYECHDASTVISHTLYQIWNGNGDTTARVSSDDLARLLLTVIMKQPPKNSSFSKFYAYLFGTAKEIGLKDEQLETIKKAFKEAGIDLHDEFKWYNPATWEAPRFDRKDPIELIEPETNTTVITPSARPTYGAPEIVYTEEPDTDNQPTIVNPNGGQPEAEPASADVPADSSVKNPSTPETQTGNVDSASETSKTIGTPESGSENKPSATQNETQADGVDQANVPPPTDTETPELSDLPQNSSASTELPQSELGPIIPLSEPEPLENEHNVDPDNENTQSHTDISSSSETDINKYYHHRDDLKGTIGRANQRVYSGGDPIIQYKNRLIVLSKVGYDDADLSISIFDTSEEPPVKITESGGSQYFTGDTANVEIGITKDGALFIHEYGTRFFENEKPFEFESYSFWDIDSGKTIKYYGYSSLTDTLRYQLQQVSDKSLVESEYVYSENGEFITENEYKHAVETNNIELIDNLTLSYTILRDQVYMTNTGPIKTLFSEGYLQKDDEPFWLKKDNAIIIDTSDMHEDKKNETVDEPSIDESSLQEAETNSVKARAENVTDEQHSENKESENNSEGASIQKSKDEQASIDNSSMTSEVTGNNQKSDDTENASANIPTKAEEGSNENDFPLEDVTIIPLIEPVPKSEPKNDSQKTDLSENEDEKTAIDNSTEGSKEIENNQKSGDVGTIPELPQETEDGTKEELNTIPVEVKENKPINPSDKSMPETSSTSESGQHESENKQPAEDSENDNSTDNPAASEVPVSKQYKELVIDVDGSIQDTLRIEQTENGDWRITSRREKIGEPDWYMPDEYWEAAIDVTIPAAEDEIVSVGYDGNFYVIRVTDLEGNIKSIRVFDHNSMINFATYIKETDGDSEKYYDVDPFNGSRTEITKDKFVTVVEEYQYVKDMYISSSDIVSSEVDLTLAQLREAAQEELYVNRDIKISDDYYNIATGSVDPYMSSSWEQYVNDMYSHSETIITYSDKPIEHTSTIMGSAGYGSVWYYDGDGELIDFKKGTAAYGSLSTDKPKETPDETGYVTESAGDIEFQMYTETYVTYDEQGNKIVETYKYDENGVALQAIDRAVYKAIETQTTTYSNPYETWQSTVDYAGVAIAEAYNDAINAYTSAIVDAYTSAISEAFGSFFG